MKKLDLIVRLVDKHKVYNLKAKYDPTTRIAEARRRFREKTPLRFIVDSDHIYEEYIGRKRRLVCYVNSANRKSVEIEKVKTVIEDGEKREENVKETVEALQSHAIHSNDPIDVEKVVKLDMLIDIAFWKSVMEKRKLALSTVFALLLAGIGIYTIFVTFLRVCGFNV